MSSLVKRHCEVTPKKRRVFMLVKLFVSTLSILAFVGISMAAENITTLKDGSELLYVNGGEFDMGSNERPYQKPVLLSKNKFGK